MPTKCWLTSRDQHRVGCSALCIYEGNCLCFLSDRRPDYFSWQLIVNAYVTPLDDTFHKNLRNQLTSNNLILSQRSLQWGIIDDNIISSILLRLQASASGVTCGLSIPSTMLVVEDIEAKQTSSCWNRSSNRDDTSGEWMFDRSVDPCGLFFTH